MSRITLTAASRIGCVRSNNEDMVLAFDKLVRSEAYETEFMTENYERYILAIADGMGGHRAGEVASEMVLSNLQFFINDLPKGLTTIELEQYMNEWLLSINNQVNSRGNADESLRDMGTTLVALLYYEGHFITMNCGDSRLYRLRDDHLKQLTTDHSLNTMTGQTKHSNIITNCIGAGCKRLYLEMEELTDAFQDGDIYLLCSDGLNDMVDDSETEQMLLNNATANRLCEAAIEAGGYDNVSTLVLRVEQSK